VSTGSEIRITRELRVSPSDLTELIVSLGKILCLERDLPACDRGLSLLMAHRRTCFIKAFDVVHRNKKAGWIKF